MSTTAPSPAAFRALLGDEAAEVARLLPKLRQLCPDIPPPLELPAARRERRAGLGRASSSAVGVEC